MCFQPSNVEVYSEKWPPAILHGAPSWPVRGDLFAETGDVWTAMTGRPALRVLAQCYSLPEELLTAKLLLLTLAALTAWRPCLC